MGGVVVGTLMIAAAWFWVAWEGRHAARDIDIDPVWDHFANGEQRWR